MLKSHFAVHGLPLALLKQIYAAKKEPESGEQYVYPEIFQNILKREDGTLLIHNSQIYDESQTQSAMVWALS